MNAMNAFVFILALVRASLYCEEKKMNCKQNCDSGWNHHYSTDHGCCESFWSCGGNKKVCQRPCLASDSQCLSYDNACHGCKQRCNTCRSGFMLDSDNYCVPEPVQSREVKEMDGQWLLVSTGSTPFSQAIVETITTSSSQELSSEEWSETSISAGVELSVSYEPEAGVGGGASASIDTSSVSGSKMIRDSTTTVGREMSDSVTQNCDINSFPWMDAGQSMGIWQYAFKGTTTDEEIVWIKSKDFRCLPIGEEPVCPPTSCIDPVCQKCPDIFPEATTSIVKCDDYFAGCADAAANRACEGQADDHDQALDVEWMINNCAKTCEWCEDDEFIAHCPADGDQYGPNGLDYCKYWTSYCSWHSLVQAECAGTCCEFPLGAAADGAAAIPPVPQEGMGTPSCLSDCDVDFMMEEPRCTFLMGCDSKDDCPCLSDCGEEDFALVMGAKGMCEKAADDMDMDAATFFSVDRPVGSNTNNILIGVTIVSLALGAIAVAVLCRFNRALRKETAHVQMNDGTSMQTDVNTNSTSTYVIS